MNISGSLVQPENLSADLDRDGPWRRQLAIQLATLRVLVCVCDASLGLAMHLMSNVERKFCYFVADIIASRPEALYSRAAERLVV